MKTSNKILLTIFISVLLIMTLIHVALNERYKSGNYIVTDLGPGQSMDTIVLKPVKFVKLNGLANVVVLTSDNFKMEFSKKMPAGFRHSVSGDTLVVNYVGTEPDASGQDHLIQLGKEIRIYLPQVELISATSSGILLAGAADSAKAGTMRVELEQSTLSFKNYRRGDETSRYYGDLSINARVRSDIELAATNIHFNALSVQLEQSNFREQLSGDIGKFSILADEESKIQVGGSNLKKLAAVTNQ